MNLSDIEAHFAGSGDGTALVQPLDEHQWTAEARTAVGNAPRSNDGAPKRVFATLANHPDVIEVLLPLGWRLLRQSAFAVRERELIILRVAWLTRSRYEWEEHTRIGRAAGVTPEEITRVVAGPDVGGWATADRILVSAVDQLVTQHAMQPETFAGIDESFGRRAAIELPFLVGYYVTLSTALRSFGVAVEAYDDPPLVASP